MYKPFFLSSHKLFYNFLKPFFKFLKPFRQLQDVHREALQEAANVARRDERGGRGSLDRMGSGRSDRMGGGGGGYGAGSGDSRTAQGPGLLRREEMLGAPIRASLGHRTASEELSFRWVGFFSVFVVGFLFDCLFLGFGGFLFGFLGVFLGYLGCFIGIWGRRWSILMLV